jgi:hypothetical protein
MKEFLDSFSNREISIVFWTIVIVFGILILNISGSLHLIKAFFAKKLFYIHCLMSLYLSAIIYSLHSMNLWESSLYKDFLFWLLTSGFVMLLSFTKLKSTRDFKNILLKILTINIVLEFVVGKL